MTNINWFADTCQCKIIFESSGETFVDWIQKCHIHKDVPDNDLLSTVLAHNHANNDTQENAKFEADRILGLGLPVVK